MARAPRGGRLRVVLGISGSIAAYKACTVVRLLVKAGCEVRVAMTANAAKFVSPLTLSALSRGPVVLDLMDSAHWDMAHLSLASWAERVLVAPATADLIARLAVGRANGPVEATVLSTKAPVLIAPAMDAEMWEHRATRDNAARLESFGYRLLGPVSGPLASGRVGMGRLMEPEEIVRRTLA
jgi:phosphopantothenoylcysteine decarboxylase/phosphopantothenate--cysteine ligase